MAVARWQWVMAAAVQWMAGCQRNCYGNWQRQREGNRMEDCNGVGTITMGNGGGSAMDGRTVAQLQSTTL
jgi:hypothetical protein